MPEIRRRVHIKNVWIVIIIDTTCCAVPVTPNNYIGGVHLHYTFVELSKKIRVSIVGAVDGANGEFFTLQFKLQTQDVVPLVPVL